MKYSAEKKKAIVLYILEKISSGTQSLSSVVAEAFGISTNTVHSYLNELIADKIIEKHKRGEYALITKRSNYLFQRNAGELQSDMIAYEKCLKNQISHLGENVKHIWEYALSEMVNNVIDHSGAENMQVIVAHNYFKTYVCVLDDGIGIFEKIKAHFSLASLDEAVCELFKGKLTTDATRHSGEGIFFTSRMMDSFLISSDGKIFTTTKYNNDNFLSVDEDTDGTCVFMSLSNFTNRTAREVFDAFSNDDGGFTTTKIPLKSIFDSAPVSRSQAKRICNRLESFKEVVLDFEDVSWMGQGFAHQIFVVYKNLHPEVSIKPINMGPDVESMYLHVTKGS